EAAPIELLQLARTYPQFPNKGTIIEGRRITVMTEREEYKIDEVVRVIHVLEAIDGARSVYVMGPKPISDEYVDGTRATPPSSHRASYDGVVIPGPAVDFNYDITQYTFHRAGRHTIEWRGGGADIEGLSGLRSNVIRLSIRAR